ncbi:hypothetical protein GCM10010361_33060 [Streptomyces olivaceiscleroticus]|uniref:Uncharacterized protein n=2 Tax=Streptomyces olivaceiscleroticus TaxID=68245 RepID=A0ABN1A376_9ACTN
MSCLRTEERWRERNEHVEEWRRAHAEGVESRAREQAEQEEKEKEKGRQAVETAKAWWGRL